MYIIFLKGICKFLANVIMCSVKDTPQCQVVVIIYSENSCVTQIQYLFAEIPFFRNTL